ncbi:integrating conjugative element protein [Verminephrobacter eiseniae]|uniref:integrating conjugative element protein n=1 Tax=Verminephrobacter eiseniae TaxID=364317 RepID=UPI00223910E7|nr:integrating conjugative element protein [Verminephrobacter eiseniae]MCW5233401.1 integrating conjugative element protein [Verminephrobacter eiseniae]MCW5295046.1 integrating conjugative element protein [Verminephrobacter eiseniae]MCW8186061.1 integrating conjugative element protein [Verminephrobacter eiseniae]MCW8224905.1 integrating conjugative element protein [Verminephrobacter eiseniae]MCW8235955.1 integrating conjugative element protein [Verminephrobacter eiseniae]
MKHHAIAPSIAVAVLASIIPTATVAQSAPLIVVEDRGGASALPYYEGLNPQPRTGQAGLVPPRIDAPHAPATPPSPQAGSEAAMLPVRSARLSPGEVTRRVIRAPGLMPLFLVGDDDRSRAWLRLRAPALRELGALGLVVNVESAEALAALRRLAPGLTLAPASGDEFAERLNLHHYPALITATGIEQ